MSVIDPYLKPEEFNPQQLNLFLHNLLLYNTPTCGPDVTSPFFPPDLQQNFCKHSLFISWEIHRPYHFVMLYILFCQINSVQKQRTVPNRPVYFLTHRMFNGAFNSSYFVTPSNRIMYVLLNKNIKLCRQKRSAWKKTQETRVMKFNARAEIWIRTYRIGSRRHTIGMPL